MYGKVTLHLPTIGCIKSSLHHVVECKLDDIHVVQEIPDVFPDELLGMHPERRKPLSSILNCSLVQLL
jgi:hypothetical protein